MKNRKYMYVDFAFYDRTGIERFLEKQAAKGWLLESTGGLLWRFTRIEPRNLRFCIVFSEEDYDFDEEPPEKLMEYLDYCEKSGWHFLGMVSCMLIFYIEQDNPTPIETDALLELDLIHEIVKEKQLYVTIPAGVLYCVLFLLQLFLLIRYSETAQEQMKGILQVVYEFFFACYFSFDTIRYFRWRIRARREAEIYGVYSGTKSLPYINTIIVLLTIFTMIFWAMQDASDTKIIWFFIIVSAGTLLVFIANYFQGRKRDKAIRKLKDRIHVKE